MSIQDDFHAPQSPLTFERQGDTLIVTVHEHALEGGCKFLIVR
jgi:hypothetical protein